MVYPAVALSQYSAEGVNVKGGGAVQLNLLRIQSKKDNSRFYGLFGMDIILE